MKTKTLRPSSCNLFAKCTAAAHGENDQFDINWEGGAAIVGSALHDAAKALVLRESIPYAEIQRKWALNKSQRREMGRMIGCVRKYCDEQLHAGGWSPTLVAEQRLEGTYTTEACTYNLGGTMDVGGMSRDGRIWGTIDWKSTRLETADYAAQQMVYLWLAKEWWKTTESPKRPEHYQYHIVYVRDWTEEVSEAYTPEELDAWMAGFIDQIESWNGRTYNPGGQCQFCPRQADCPAVYRLVSAMAMSLKGEGFDAAAENASDDQLIEFKKNAALITNLTSNALELLKALVVGRGGEIPGAGGVLTISTRPRYTIDPLTAWPICEKGLTEEEIANACRLSKTELLAGVASHAPRGQKKKAKEAFWEELCDADAVEENASVILTLQKARTIETNFED